MHNNNNSDNNDGNMCVSCGIQPSKQWPQTQKTKTNEANKEEEKMPPNNSLLVCYVIIY